MVNQSERRRSSMTVMYHMTNGLTKMMAPILSFLSDEVHSYFPGDKGEEYLVERFPSPQEDWEF